MLVSRDPFARTELHAARVYEIGNRQCLECGNVRYTPKKNVPFLMRFWTESDGGRTYPIANLFCSVSCMRVYSS